MFTNSDLYVYNGTKTALLKITRKKVVFKSHFINKGILYSSKILSIERKQNTWSLSNHFEHFDYKDNIICTVEKGPNSGIYGEKHIVKIFM